MLSIDHRRRAFFKYEKRIRELSPPEKIFEYFASQGDTKTGFLMTPCDMMRSVVPVFPPEGSEIVRAGALPGEPSPRVPQQDSAVFRAFDMDSIEGIGLAEWLLFEALLSIPAEDVEVAFSLMDVDGNGTVSAAEFEALLAAIQARAALRLTASLRRSSGDLTSSHGGMSAAFFGKDGKKALLGKKAEFLKAADTLDFAIRKKDPVKAAAALAATRSTLDAAIAALG